MWKPPAAGRHSFRAAVLIALVALTFGIVLIGEAQSNFVDITNHQIRWSGTGTSDWANGTDDGPDPCTHTPLGGGAFTRNCPGEKGIFDGGTFLGNDTPPTPPSLTSYATNTLGLVAGSTAAFAVDPLSGDKTTCGTGDPTVYTGAGSEKNGDLLDGETYSTGSVPAKDDLANVYAVALRTATVYEIFFGAERNYTSGQGDSHIDFEFLQADVTSDGGCSGSISGDRTQGDFLLAVDFGKGGTLGGNTLYKWYCTTPSTDGTVCNEGSYVEEGSESVTFGVNSSPINCGGWACRHADGSFEATVDSNKFMEGGIDLQALDFTGCTHTFLPHTRSSTSFTATLKDFAIATFNSCGEPAITTTPDPTSGNIGDLLKDKATLSGTVNGTGTITFKLYGPSQTTCTGTPVHTEDVTVNGNGDYTTPTGHTANAAGTWRWVASYSGDAINPAPDPTACDDEQVTINKNSPTVSTTVHPAGPINVGADAYDSATLHDATTNAGGTVTYKLYSDNACTTLVADLTPDTNTVVDAVAPDSKSHTFNSAGTFYFYAVYSGDDNNDGANSGCAAEPLVVKANPAPHSTPVAQIKDTITVSGLSSSPTGNVAVGVYTDNACTTRVLGTSDWTFAASDFVGGATKSTDFIGPASGTYYYKISYGGDTYNTGFSSCAESVAVTITSLP